METPTKGRKPVKKAARRAVREVPPSFVAEAVVGVPRTQTQVRLDPELKAAAIAAATERGVSLNTFFNRAVEDFLSRLRPAEELKWTSD